MALPINHEQNQCPFSGIDTSKLEKIPVPPMKYFGLLGHLPEIDKDFPVSSLWKFMDNHGPILETDLQGRRILVGSHELFSEMLDEETWVKQPSKAQLQLRNVGGGDGLVTAFSGEKNWGIARRLLNPAFGPLGLRNMFDDMLEISSQLVLLWDRYGPDNEIECVDAFTRLTFDTIGLCAFNVRFNEFYMKEVHPFVKHLSQGLIECGRRANRPEILNTLLFYRAEKERQANMKRMRELSDQIVRDWEANPKPGATSTDFLNVLLYGVDKETGEKVPSENVRYQIATFLAAGYDTTASSLAFLYYYLCDNPKCLIKAQKEVDEVIGENVVTVDMLSKLTYLKACIQESLRLNSPVNILNRDATKDTVLGGKYLINKGLSVSCLLRHLHRDPKVWGDDADEFRPERMLNGGFEALPASAWKPFGNGSRVCIGQGFAEQEMLISLSQVLQRFYIQKADPSYKLVLRSTLTTKPANFKMKVCRRPDRHILVGIPGGNLVDSAQKKQPRQQRKADRQPGETKPICVFVGGNMGTSEGLAHDLAEKAPDFGLEVEIRDLDAAVESLPTDKPCIIITASYEGKPPDNARKFVAWIEHLSHESAILPENTRYAVFGVGNSDWASTFHRIPKLIDNTLSKLSAERIIEARYSNVKLDIMGPWEEWSEQLLVKLSNSKAVDQVSAGVEISIEKSTHIRRQTQSGEELSNATIISNHELADTSVGAAKRHVDLRLSPGCEFVPGDYLIIQGRNSEVAVRRVLARFELGKHDIMTVKASKKNFLPTQPTEIGHFLSTSVELATPITKRQLSTLTQWAEQNSWEHKKLQNMQRDEVYKDLLEKRYSIIDILEDLPGLRLPFGVYVVLLLPLNPRQYSISSAPEETNTGGEGHGAIASITFDVFEEPAKSGHGTFRGVVSSYLSACRPGDRIQCVVRPNTLGFSLPPNSETPIVMLAAGTGIAPIRAFISKRSAIKKAGLQKLGPAILFFGCRNPEKDYIYRSDLEEWEREGIVEVVPCFSKPGGGQRGKHVPDALWDNRDRVWDMLQSGGRIYTCGSAARLGRSSADMIKRIYSEKTKRTELEADEWLDEIKSAGAYVRDVY